MESTGVYWIPIFEILEERGFEALARSRYADYRSEIRWSRCDAFSAPLQVFDYEELALVGPPGLEPGTDGL